ncbi:hypothetical protein ACHHYP_06525, partial [Achlya hypogyna]
MRRRTVLTLGLIYLCATVAGSLSYLKLSTVSLANDFWWATFNTTGAQTFLANWYNRYLLISPSLGDVRLDSSRYGDTTDYSTASTLVAYSPLYPSIVQYQVASDVILAIRGLRTMDACHVPWISTQYCWLDFDQRWPMANSLRRQERCQQRYATNGAIYLEAPLRNLNWAVFGTCWGDSFDVAFAMDLRRDATGTSWLASVQQNSMPEADEAMHWHRFGITSYTTQWQNYKSIGLTDTIAVENAFGFQYSLTLKATPPSFDFTTQTTMKMYWTFASDLWAVMANGTGITGQSLLRTSARFAFANSTPEAVYFTNSTLVAPLDVVFSTFQIAVGPFGS